ncbi:MAG: hypothetical protein IJN48_02325 [Clostridia bacterium]|nr:hypothetical protein [Clostridia bacterium]
MRFLKVFFKKRSTDVEDGGIQKRLDRNAPKSIVSENIIAFDCVFSTVALADDISIEHGIYTLSARLKDGAVRGEYKMRTRLGSGEQFLFRDSHRFMRTLQDTVRTYDFAKFNGEEYYVSGLPDMYGAKIHVIYASGERIDASDNQSNFLPIEAMAELVKLFLSKKR